MVFAFAIGPSIADAEIHVAREDSANTGQLISSRRIFLLRLIFHRAACTRDGSRSTSTFSSINSNWCRSIYLSTKRFLRADDPMIFPIIHLASSPLLVENLGNHRNGSSRTRKIERHLTNPPFLLNLPSNLVYLPSMSCWWNSISVKSRFSVKY